MKRKLRTATKPLAQLCRRLYEEYINKPKKVQIPPTIEILKSTDAENHTKIKYKENIISTKSPDNIVLLSNKKVFKVRKIYGPIENLSMEGRIWKKKTNLFLNTPFLQGNSICTNLSHNH